MTPAHIDVDVLTRKLRHMKALLDDLAQVGEVTAERLERERMLRHGVERILTQLVDLGVSINAHIAAASLNRAPLSYRDSFAAAAEAGAIPTDLAQRLAPSAGLRNVLVHEYVDVDLGVVAAAVELTSSGYGDYVRSVTRYVQENRPPA